jgi:LCP family protein required for cell wall assembly
LRERTAPQTQPVGIARHGRLKKSSPVPAILKFLAAAIAVVLVSAASVAAIAVNTVTSKVKTVELVQPTDGPPPQIGAIEGGFNILIVGSDTCEESMGNCGDRDSTLNDVNILLHVSQDQTNAVAVSFPRDMVVGIPECTWQDGSGDVKGYSTEPLNVALYYGGLPCVAQTITELTGLDIQYAGMITFGGVIAMADAVGGVDVCVNGPVIDEDTGINLPEAGNYTLSGFQALAFLRTRGGVGDGSDLTRISSQQVYLSSLVRTLKSSDTLGDPRKVFNLANAALSNMVLSSSMASVNTMVSMGLALKDVPLESVTFVQYPGFTGNTEGIYAGKVRPDTATGDELMALIKADQPFRLAAVGDGRGSELNPNAPAPAPEVEPTTGPDADPEATEAPPIEEPEVAAPDPSTLTVLEGVNGQTAADYTCSISNY